MQLSSTHVVQLQLSKNCNVYFFRYLLRHMDRSLNSQVYCILHSHCGENNMDLLLLQCKSKHSHCGKINMDLLFLLQCKSKHSHCGGVIDIWILLLLQCKSKHGRELFPSTTVRSDSDIR